MPAQTSVEVPSDCPANACRCPSFPADASGGAGWTSVGFDADRRDGSEARMTTADDAAIGIHRWWRRRRRNLHRPRLVRVAADSGPNNEYATSAIRVTRNTTSRTRTMSTVPLWCKPDLTHPGNPRAPTSGPRPCSSLSAECCYKLVISSRTLTFQACCRWVHVGRLPGLRT